MRLPTHHPESKNGWNGANNDGISVSTPCDICGEYAIEKVIYHSLLTDSHIVVCWECSKKLPKHWHGCGCGG